ncbi:UDP-2,4-diacetamido-2,4,6-trideoxy-beta-L-altropyranose hydrolase [Shewanella halifaxensis]|uniref:UDP-2,4-diacetamido-2,4, 6-trideoxy-beta-L-altropyranose hydrolase n=1 Tax=Shewanella halifaxensis TaxID=271098 RepID=UPI000D59C846|nr:UDP-2,4-diacetamido-2,4,6-trideoxy-beta-L-altropyranose hydrolase [Shewanella halifaxensis]
MKRVLFRVDASSAIGSGHVMRCLTLAKKISTVAQCYFICERLPGSLEEFIEAQGFSVYLLPAGLSQIQQAERTIRLAGEKYDWVVIDHYQLDIAYESGIRAIANRVMVIDDLANREHDCDLLLDQGAVESTRLKYRSLTPEGCQLLLGVNYCLLREEFFAKENAYHNESDRLLVSLGGSDPHNYTDKVIKALLSIKWEQPVDIVLGGKSPWNQQLQAEYADKTFIHWHIQCDYMASLMRGAKLAIGAGGSSHLERCISALPAIVMTVAENQEQGSADLAGLNVCINLGKAELVNETCISAAITELWNNDKKLASMRRSAAAIVPENGVNKVVEAILGLSKSNEC